MGKAFCKSNPRDTTRVRVHWSPDVCEESARGLLMHLCHVVMRSRHFGHSHRSSRFDDCETHTLFHKLRDMSCFSLAPKCHHVLVFWCPSCPSFFLMALVHSEERCPHATPLFSYSSSVLDDYVFLSLESRHHKANVFVACIAPWPSACGSSSSNLPLPLAVAALGAVELKPSDALRFPAHVALSHVVITIMLVTCVHLLQKNEKK